eukprot:jgi/Chrzof1/6896/Cz02g02150.t1
MANNESCHVDCMPESPGQACGRVHLTVTDACTADGGQPREEAHGTITSEDITLSPEGWEVGSNAATNYNSSISKYCKDDKLVAVVPLDDDCLCQLSMNTINTAAGDEACVDATVAVNKPANRVLLKRLSHKAAKVITKTSSWVATSSQKFLRLGSSSNRTPVVVEGQKGDTAAEQPLGDAFKTATASYQCSDSETTSRGSSASLAVEDSAPAPAATAHVDAESASSGSEGATAKSSIRIRKEARQLVARTATALSTRGQQAGKLAQRCANWLQSRSRKLLSFNSSRIPAMEL